MFEYDVGEAAEDRRSEVTKGVGAESDSQDSRFATARTHVAVLAVDGTILHLALDRPSASFDTEKALGTSVLRYLASECHDSVSESIAAASLGAARECEITDLEGRVYAARYTPLQSDGGAAAVLSVATDVTERRHIETALANSERKYRDLVENLNDVVFSMDDQGIVTFMSPAVEAIVGFTAEQLVGQPFSEFIHPEDLPGLWTSYQSTLAGASEPSEYRVRTRSGHYRWVRSHSRQTRDDGNVVGIQGVIADITERRRAEGALREAEQRYRSMFENAAFGISISTPDGRFLDVNRSLVAMLGYETAEELKAVDIADALYVEPDERDRVLSWIRGGESVTPIEVRWKRKDGEILTARLSGRAIRNEQDVFVGFECMAENATERHALEEQYRQAQKMEAIGRLAGGVAHDFNNLLTVINGHADLLLSGVDPGERSFKDLSEIRRAGERAASLTSQLLAFSRRQILQPVVLDLNEIIDNGTDMLRRIVGEHIELRAELSDHLGNFVADRSQVEQVLVNLVVNARDAMASGGRLTIRTECHTLSADRSSEHATIPAGTYVVLTCADTGCGIRDEIRKHIFEPFFTTKEESRGTGLGLSTVYGILEQSGGFIEVDTSVSEGTCFSVYFPVVERDAAPSESAIDNDRPVSGHGKVLVVEDDDAVRVTTVEMLQMCGYTVSEACNAEEALGLTKDEQAALDLLITDVVMPGMSGRELAERMAADNSDLAIIFMTGYADEDVLGDSVTRREAALLKKPFSITHLAEQARAALKLS